MSQAGHAPNTADIRLQRIILHFPPCSALHAVPFLQTVLAQPTCLFACVAADSLLTQTYGRVTEKPQQQRTVSIPN